MPKVYKKVNGSWVPIKSIYKKVDGNWVRIKRAYKKVAGQWYLVFTGKTYIEQSVKISQTIDSATDLYTLTGTNYHWTPDPASLDYEFRKDGVGVIGTGTIQNPPVGSSNTKDFLISASANIITPNEANVFRFVVIATYAGMSEESISGTTTIYGAEDITLSAGTAGILEMPLSWTSSTHANRYQIQYKKTSDTTWTTATGVDKTILNYTVQNLLADTSYDFRVRPWTGNSGTTGSYTGYPGNWSNTVTIKTLPNKPKINSFTVSGTTGAVIYSYNITCEDPNYTISLTGDRRVGSTYDGQADVIFNPTSLTASNVTSGYVAGAFYKFTLTITANTSGLTDSITSPEIEVTTLVASNLSVSDITSQSSPSGVSVTSPATNTGRISWTNGTDAYNVSVSGTGAVPVSYTSSTLPLPTSYDFVITNSGTENATVTNSFKGKVAISWNQAGAQSYWLRYSVGPSGILDLKQNNNSSSVDLPFTTSGSTVTVYSLNVYSGLNQTGTAWPGGYTYPVSNISATGNDRSAQATGSGTLTKVSTDSSLSALSISNVTLSPSFSSSTYSYTSTVSNSVSSVTVTPTASSSSSTITVNGTTVTSGSASQSISLTSGSSTTINIIVTAQSGSQSTYTITISRNQPAIAITLSSVTSSSTGFTFSLTSAYDSSWTWTASINGNPAGVTISPSSGSSTGQVYTVSGMDPLTVTVATATVSATKAGYDPASASVTGNAVTTTVSGWAITDITSSTPTPSSIAVGNSTTNNVGLCSWTNGTGTDRAWMSSVSGSGSGAQTDNGTARTSATFSIISSGVASVVVTNVALGKARISWNQTNTKSYQLVYSVGGTQVGSGIYVNNSSSSVNVDLTSNGTAITLVSLTVYPNQNGGGTGVPAFLPTTKSVTPSNKTGTGNGAGFVLYAAAPHFPPFFPPHFPPFFPPHFPPFFPPFFAAPFFPPYFAACIDEDTLIAVVGENNSIEYKPAKNIQLGDKVWSVKWDGLEDERNVDPYSWFTDELNNIQLTQTNIVNIIPSVKDVTILINNKIEKRFSLEQTVLLKRAGKYFFGTTGTLEIGDILLEKTEDGNFIEISIQSLDIIDEQRTVYQFDAEPGDILIAGNLLVHNAKGFA